MIVWTVDKAILKWSNFKIKVYMIIGVHTGWENTFDDQIDLSHSGFWHAGSNTENGFWHL